MRRDEEFRLTSHVLLKVAHCNKLSSREESSTDERLLCIGIGTVNIAIGCQSVRLDDLVESR